jgi:hypothetical protein
MELDHERLDVRGPGNLYGPEPCTGTGTGTLTGKNAGTHLTEAAR